MRKLPSIIPNSRYGSLVLTDDIEKREKSHVYVRCNCDCGWVGFKRFSDINAGRLFTCGSRKCQYEYKRIKLNIGDRYGRLTIVDFELIGSKRGYRKILVVCDCKNELTVNLYDLRSGQTNSCGCYQKEQASKASITHGQCNHPIHSSWSAMLNRCRNPNLDAYKDYGGRGVGVCELWANSFEEFYKWSIENGWSSKLTIDRINNNGNYEPSNCRWATCLQQSKNRRSNINIEAFGEIRCAKDWAKDERCVITYAGLIRRIKKGWDAESAISKGGRWNAPIKNKPIEIL